VKEGRIGTKDGKPLPGADEPLHAYITSDVDENVKKGADRVLIILLVLIVEFCNDCSIMIITCTVDVVWWCGCSDHFVTVLVCMLAQNKNP